VPPEMIQLVCIQCGKPFEREARLERHNRNQGKRGPFHNKACAAKYVGLQQPNVADRLIASRGQHRAEHGTESMYRLGCRCDSCRDAHAERARIYRSSK
jgi:hypothetical protein